VAATDEGRTYPFLRSQALERSRAFFMRGTNQNSRIWILVHRGESSFMRASSGTPSIVPHSEAHDIDVVEHDPGPHGPVWAEVASKATGFEPVVMDLLTGRYTKPLRVVVFNVAGGWCRDASVEVAHELRQRCDLQLRDIPFSCRTSWIGTKAAIATFSCRCRCACSSTGDRRRRGFSCWWRRPPEPAQFRSNAA
jgi:hypothetical protein